MIDQHRIRICPEAWYYALVLALLLSVGIMREANLLLLVAGLLCGPLLLGWRLAVRTLRDLDVRRRVPQAICAGDLLVVNVNGYEIIPTNSAYDGNSVTMMRWLNRPIRSRLKRLGVSLLDWNPKKETFDAVLLKTVRMRL